MKISAHGKTIKVNLNFNKGVFTNAQGEETDESDGDDKINSLQTARQYMLMDDRITGGIIRRPVYKEEPWDSIINLRYKEYNSWKNQEIRNRQTKDKIA